MDFLNTTESLFNYDDTFNLTSNIDNSTSNIESFNLTSNIESLNSMSNITNLTTNVVRHNCTGASEESMRTYHTVSWWFTGIVQVIIITVGIA
jgi:hypothetical protein